jgi:hypothetical protein
VLDQEMIHRIARDQGYWATAYRPRSTQDDRDVGATGHRQEARNRVPRLTVLPSHYYRLVISCTVRYE